MLSYTFDLHQDISDALLYSTRADFWQENTLHQGSNDLNLPVNNQIDYIRLKKSNIKAVFAVTCAIGIDLSKKDSQDPASCVVPAKDHFRESLKHINLYHNLKRQSKGEINFILSPEDLDKIPEYEISFLLAMEGADSLTDSFIELYTYYNLGLRSISLTWSYTNNLAGGCNYPDDGLTEIGKKIIKEMNKLGIILDLAHINEKSFYQALEVNEKPAIISHTASKSVYNHPRNVTDDQLKAIAQTRGVVGIFGIPRMIGDIKNKDLTLEDIYRHIDYVVNLIGIDYISIGSDFGAMLDTKLIQDFYDVTCIDKLIDFLKNKGYTQEHIDKITHQNIERVLREVLPSYVY